MLRLSKILRYEKPCSVTGTRWHIGSKRAPKVMHVDRIVGTWKANDMEVLTTCEVVIRKILLYITNLNIGESGGIVPMKISKDIGGIASSQDMT